jgi:flagellar biosynthesis anti-sigma factor FlgM
MKIPSELPGPELDPKIGSSRETSPDLQRNDRFAPGGAPTGETVELSARARELAQLSVAVQAVPEARSERLDEIRASLQAGTYEVRSEDVAESILKGLLVDFRL